ncbi:uncharacterized protein [Nothobranchius furzeri]|uniref:uncharacterized protein n=1 Tax=Nothobranchius furzeri TaxID=105023 RepID=UPI0039049C0B
MDRISRRSRGVECVEFGGRRISSLLFADDVVLLASSSSDLQLLLGRFAAECEAAGMRVSTSNSETMVLDRKRVACPLRVEGEALPQVEEFKYLRVLFTSEGRRDREIGRRIGSASAVMQTLSRSVVVKRELSQKARLSITSTLSTGGPHCEHNLGSGGFPSIALNRKFQQVSSNDSVLQGICTSVPVTSRFTTHSFSWALALSKALRL